MNQDKFTLLKSHVEAYTRKDGAAVKAHDTKVFKVGDNASDSGGVSMVGRHKSDLHRDAMVKNWRGR